MIRRLRWTIENLILAACLWFGFGPERMEGARNVAIFYLWLALISSFISYAPDIRAKFQERGRGVPAALDNLVSTACIFFLAWQGHWVLAVVLLVIVGNITNLYDREASL